MRSKTPSLDVTRSQAILLMPVDNVTAVVTLDDGERVDCMLFIPAGEDVSRILCESKPFVPVVARGLVCLIGRSAIASVAVSKRLAGKLLDEDLKFEVQRAIGKLRSGTSIEGELCWIAPEP